MNALKDTTDKQRLAASPARSAFVMANAGLRQNPGSDQPCRPAAPCRELIRQKYFALPSPRPQPRKWRTGCSKTLGKWALSDKDTLEEELKELEGDAFQPRNDLELTKARRLFARALETPGGLKIQTIHSFCESVLRRFPIEAGAPPGFSVIEDKEARALIDQAINQLAVGAHDDPQINQAFNRLSVRQNETDLRGTLRNVIYDRLGYEANLARYESLKEIIASLASSLDIDPDATEETIKAQFLAGLDSDELRAAMGPMREAGKQTANLAENISAYLNAGDRDGQWNALTPLFLTAGGDIRTKFTTNALEKLCQTTADFLVMKRGEFHAAAQTLKSIQLFQDTKALYTLIAPLLEKYAALKAARGGLDFDDLIKRTETLFNNTRNDWVMYKLDYGIDHILIDEAQDTSPLQWAVIEALFQEYLSGDGARQSERSFFAVGDLKQSIYSFQGADAGLFAEKETNLGKQLAKVTDYSSVPLALSFRTTEPVLTFVDALFYPEEAREGLGNEKLAHKFNREGQAGRVELWPLAPRREPDTPEPWDAPVDNVEESHPDRTLSERIAATIQQWLDGERRLPSKGRAVAPGDILVLVQSRGTIFDSVIERLAVKGVPVAGADRLKLLEDPAVEDFLSFMRFATTPEDDLSLAELLKSPLFCFEDDRDLFPLAYGRPNGRSLWAALNAKANEKAEWRAARDEIKTGAYDWYTRGALFIPLTYFTQRRTIRSETFL